MPKQANLLAPNPFKSEALLEQLADKCEPLWEQGRRQVPQLDLNENILKALAFIRRCGSLRVGLEQIEIILQKEEAGLVLMNKPSIGKRIQSLNVGENISRLFLMSNDGSQRFYRHVETMLNQYSHRLLGVKLNVSSAAMGQIFYGREKLVKSLLVTNKEAVGRVLSSLI